MPLRTGCSAGYPPTGGTRTRFELTAGTRWSSIWAPPTGCWWWTRPASSRRGARRGASRWGCRGSTAAPRGADRKFPSGSIPGRRWRPGPDPAGPGVVAASGMGGGPGATPCRRGAGACRIPHPAAVGPVDAGAGGGIGNSPRLGYWRRGLRQRPQPAAVAGGGGHPPGAGPQEQRAAVGRDRKGAPPSAGRSFGVVG